MTKLVVKTIVRNTEPDMYRLNVFDNGSDARTIQMLYELQDEGLIDRAFFSDKNEGLEAARQFMLEKMTDSEYFVCIDNDCLPPIDWLSRQLELMQQYEDYAAISQRTPVMIGTGNIFEDTDKNGMPLTDFPHPGGSFRMMRTDAVRRVGGWDRDNPGRGQEERYICGKLREAGYGTAFATHIQCLHLFGNRQKTQERWGYTDGMKPEDTGHSDVWHPILGRGDDFDEVAAYTGKELAEEYFSW